MLPEESLLDQAATDPTVTDDTFVSIARALRGQDPLTGDAAAHEAAEPVYFVAPDADGTEILWRANGACDSNPAVLIGRSELDSADAQLWPALLAGLAATGAPLIANPYADEHEE